MDTGKLHITLSGTSFVRNYLEVLSKFNVVQVSIDTADDALFRRIRRNVGLDRIIFNINKIRATAISKGEKPPIFTVSCGIYNKNVFLFEDFAWFVISLGVSGVTFWNLRKYSYKPNEENIDRLDSLSDDLIREALKHYDNTIDILTQNNINISVAGNFLEALKIKLNGASKTEG